MKLTRKKACAECPFKKGSIRGWLGPWTAQELLAQAHSEGGFACHMSVNDLIEEGYEEGTTELQEDVHVCVGSLQHANRACKSFRPGNPLVDMARSVGKSNEILNPREFMNHHTINCQTCGQSDCPGDCDG